jgi:hypothetical protein
MRRRWLVLYPLALAACGSTEPAASSVAGYFAAAGRPDLHVFLYDDAPGDQPEQFFVRRQMPGAIGYSWGEYAERGDSLRLGLYDAKADSLTRAHWIERPTTFRVDLAGVPVTFERIADEPPEGAPAR